MATKAQILAAAKKIVADAAKKPAKRKTNPAPRIGTKKPNRVSQITKAKPTKRLVKRRKANEVEGYFPNPSEIKRAHTSTAKQRSKGAAYRIQILDNLDEWTDVALAWSEQDAANLAHGYAARTGKKVRVVK